MMSLRMRREYHKLRTRRSSRRKRQDDELEVEEKKAEDEKMQHDDELEAEERIVEDERKLQDDELAAWIAAEELGLQALLRGTKKLTWRSC